MHKARSSAAPLLLALAQSASADIVLSRTVNSLSAGSIKVTLDGGACASSDAYGSNQCDLDWGKSYEASVNGTLSKDIESGDTFSASIKVDSVFKLDFTCQLCGAECSFEVPVIKQKVSFQMPDCPIKAQALRKTISLALPATSPVPVKVGFKGTVSAQDKAGNSLASVNVQGDVTKDHELVEAGDARPVLS